MTYRSGINYLNIASTFHLPRALNLLCMKNRHIFILAVFLGTVWLLDFPDEHRDQANDVDRNIQALDTECYRVNLDLCCDGLCTSQTELEENTFLAEIHFWNGFWNQSIVSAVL